MRTSTSARFDYEYDRLPATLKTRVDKQLKLLVQNLHYPSLRAKKYDESHDTWQARITRGHRLYFQIEGDTYKLLTIT